MNNTAQDVYIQGGGTLMDWAHLKKQNNEIQQNIINIIFIFNRYE